MTHSESAEHWRANHDEAIRRKRVKDDVIRELRARLTALEQENKRLREALLKEFRINNMQSGMKREYAIVEAEHDLANLMRIKT